MNKILFIFFGVMLIASSVFAAEVKSDASKVEPARLGILYNATSLKCVFGPGSVVNWESGEPKISKDEFNATLHFDSINMESKTARLIGNQGATDVSVHFSLIGITFIEFVAFGNMNFTTVYRTKIEGSNLYVAVTSRHILSYDHPLPSQYHGHCQIWE